jgi:hypothetical protein
MPLYILTKVKVKVTLRLTVCQSVSLGVEPNLGLLTRDFLPPKLLTKLHGLSPRANYTDKRRSECQLVQIEGATWSA